jgi:hypothetical protein
MSIINLWWNFRLRLGVLYLRFFFIGFASKLFDRKTPLFLMEFCVSNEVQLTPRCKRGALNQLD